MLRFFPRPLHRQISITIGARDGGDAGDGNGAGECDDGDGGRDGNIDGGMAYLNRARLLMNK